MIRQKKKGWLFACIAAAVYMACSSDSSPMDVIGGDASEAGPVDAPTNMPVTLRFRAMVGDQPFACTQIYHRLGSTMTDWHPGDFRLYVHSVRLLTAGGAAVPVQLDEDGLWQHAGVALLDFEDKMGTCTMGTTQTNDHIVGRVALGAYVGIRFNVGVPFDQDHQDVSVAPSPLNITGMFWSWASGYKFLKIEGSTTGIPTGFNIHLGSTGCVADAMGHVNAPCSAPNVPEITLMGFDPATQSVVADLAMLTRLRATSTSTHPTHRLAACRRRWIPNVSHC